MSDRSGLSRRGLFTFGLSRLAAEFDAHPVAAPRPSPPAEDRAARVERVQRAWNRCEDTDLWAQAASVLVARAAPRPGEEVLDAAAGDGNVAVLAAAAGATVTACDIAPALVARGGERSAAAALDVRWLQADIADLPFADATFDRVLSTFGPMFCHDGRAAIGELFRVVRPGGTVAFTAWPAHGLVGRLLRLAAAQDPPPRGMPGPLAWAREERLRRDLEDYSDRVEFEFAQLSMTFTSAEDAVHRLVRALGPLAAITPADELHADVHATVEELASNQPGPIVLSAPYLVTLAEVRAA